ncbi:hypothetical protein GPECTOR_25g345 [Gonium pectorale]|uniref:peptidylprolyl isomerase n=1 Tax=Gonium pectorale TaxID=33097 RepID=A0A150GFZ6_GONPE|nr:hypothetical protein GPECTOR_25g345 [Gonium pectorale]|eukprot:KXZ48761.1 hypothetical protein GPECTOR_25g345 [Gonium pectorale]
MGQPFPTRHRPPHHYYPIFATLLMVTSIVCICIWIHYTQAMIYHIKSSLDVVGNNTAADNFFVLSQSVIATSVLYFIYGIVIYGLCLWRALLEAEIDRIGEVKDKLGLYTMGNLCARVCWWAIMTWIVVLLAGCSIFGVYISNFHYFVKTTLENQDTMGGYSARAAPYPDCPAICVDLWRIDYIDVPMDVACVCDRATLQSLLIELRGAKDATPGCLAGVFFMYVIGGWWRSELSKHYASAQKEQDVAQRLAEGGGAGAGSGPTSSGRGVGRGGLEAGLGGAGGGYKALAGGPGGSGRAGGALGVAAVYIHYSIRDQEDDLLYSTRSEEGGSGQAFAFLMEKGLRVPRGWEIALKDMSKGQRNVLQLKPEFGFGHPECLMRPPVKGLPTDKVRDMTGTGEVTKKRLREGTGEFPMDCPLHDTTVLLHYKVRPHGLQLSTDTRTASTTVEGGWLYDSRAAQEEPLTVDTGCGELPDGLEMALKLMVPGEVAAVVAAPRYAYAGRDDAPPGCGLLAERRDELTVEWEVELVDFEREGHWQNLSFEERYAVAERLKAKGNDLYRRQQYKFARARYDRLIRLLESTRDFETDEQVARIDGYKTAALGNLALACIGMGEHAAAVAACNKALESEPENAKLLFRKGRALSLKGDYEEAAEELRLALEYDPGSEKDINAELAANAERHKAALRKQRRDFGNFLAPSKSKG